MELEKKNGVIGGDGEESNKRKRKIHFALVELTALHLQTYIFSGEMVARKRCAKTKNQDKKGKLPPLARRSVV